MFLWAILAIPLILALGLGLLILLIIPILMFIYPIINGMRAGEGKPVSYPFTISFLK